MRRSLRIGDVLAIERGTTYKSALLDQPGPILLGLGTIQRHGGFRADSLRTYGGDSPENLLVQPGGLYASLKDVTQTADLLGAVARVPKDVRLGRLTQDTVRLDIFSQEVSPDYMYWVLRTPQYREYCRAHATGTTTMGLPRQDFFRFEFPAPDTVRQMLVELLGALDDKIAANDRVQAAVDEFLAAVFDRLRVGRGEVELREIADVNVRVTKPREEGLLRYLDISAVERGRYQLPAPMAWSAAPGRARRALRSGDTVWSTVRPNRRAHALVLDDDPQLIASTGLAVLSPKEGRVASLFEATRTPEFVAYLESVAEGSAYPAVRADRFASALIPDLEPSDWEGFEQLALPVRMRAHAAAAESRTLSSTRDELLPLLMSGKVRVRDAERAVEKAL